MAASIFLKSIAKKISNKSVIANLDFGLQNGDRLAVIGANGCGKTPLLKIIAGIVDPDSGQIFINGEELNSKKYDLRKKICYIPDYTDFDDNLNIIDNLYIYLRLNTSNSKKESSDLIHHWAGVFNFSKLLKSKINSINQSKLRLIQLSKVFMHNPDFLVLDHPTVGLDPEHKIWFWSTINSVLKSSTIVYSSQDFDEIQSFSNRIVFLSEGNIRLNGTIKDIMDKTKEYGSYSIVFKDKVDSSLSIAMQENSDLYHLKIEHNKVEFYTPNKKTFFDLIRKSIDYDLVDIKTNSFNLKDVFLAQVKKI
ncbi:MAG: hypothetical protein CMG11_01810 [Candidatus Marinimicrobia bacterium]|nr:hypothetical protein [Candidatus Neomarinimicrobiota bacterium]|tara:strand:- start:4898 stop:5821 length:924 start_codon:yes stop_codon:yes gene_type:complete